MKEKIFKAFEELGFKLNEIESGTYSFQYEGSCYLFTPNKENENFIHISAPYVSELTEEKVDFDLCHLANKLNIDLSYTKAYVFLNGLWISHEQNVEGRENELKDLIALSILYIDSTINYTRDLLLKGYPNLDEEEDCEEEEEEDEDIADMMDEYLESESNPQSLHQLEEEEEKGNSSNNSVISNIRSIWKRIKSK